MLTNDNNFNGKKQTFVHKICNFVIFFCFCQFYAFLPRILYNYSKIFMHKIANIHFSQEVFSFAWARTQ